VKAWERANPPAVEMKQPASEFLIDNPKYTSLTQRKDEQVKEARKRLGLAEKESDVKVTSKDPQMGYVKQPKAKSKTLLEMQRKEEMLKDLKKLE